jgi:hypothetical protein
VGLIGDLPGFMGDGAAAMLDESARLVHAQRFIGHEHKSVGDAEREPVEREVLFGHEGQKLRLSLGELAHERAELGEEPLWERDERLELGHQALGLYDDLPGRGERGPE